MSPREEKKGGEVQARFAQVAAGLGLTAATGFPVLSMGVTHEKLVFRLKAWLNTSKGKQTNNMR